MGSPKPRIELSIPNADIANADIANTYKANKEPPKKKKPKCFNCKKKLRFQDYVSRVLVFFISRYKKCFCFFF